MEVTVENKDIETLNNMTESRFNNLLIKFLLDEPFFSSIIRHMRKIKTDIIPTAGVTCKDNSICLYWNPKFISTLTKRQVFGLLKHECYHLIFKHLTSRKQEPHLLWNIATDLAINSTIPSDELPEGGLIPGKPLDMSKSSHLSEKMLEQAKKMSDFIASLPLNKASEWYMEQLQKDPDIQQACQEIFEPGSGDGSCAGFDFHFDDDMSDAEKAIADAKVSKIVKDAVDRAQRNNSWGSTSASMRSKIIAMLDDTIDWKQVLRYFCGTKQRSNKTRSIRKINRKYPYIHSGRKIKHTSNLAIYIDQSGSVGDDDISLFFGALSGLSKDVTFTVYHFDTNVDENSKYIWKKRMSSKTPFRTRSGGTCFNCVEQHFRKVSGEFDGYIIMTDGAAPKPKTCTSKRCWVVLPNRQLYFDHDKRDTVVIMKR